MSKSVLVVSTVETREQIIKAGGSQPWVLSLRNAGQCAYLVCTRSRKATNAPEVHGAAFLVGRVCAIEPTPLHHARRFIVRISEYALLESQRAVWTSRTSPLCYVADLADLQINQAELDWQPAPSHDTTVRWPGASSDREAGPLTLEAAKEALAKTFGVSPDNVEIVIRA